MVAPNCGAPTSEWAERASSGAAKPRALGQGQSEPMPHANWGLAPTNRKNCVLTCAAFGDQRPRAPNCLGRNGWGGLPPPATTNDEADAVQFVAPQVPEGL